MSPIALEHVAVDVVVADGSTVRIRPARPEDEEPLEDYLIGLSPESRQLRFWTPSVDVRDIATKAVDVDLDDHVTLLAFLGRGRIVGTAEYRRMDAARAEISISVTDEMQGKGLGSILIAQLAHVASDEGIPFFVAEVLPENHRMIQVFRRSGFLPSIRARPGVIEIEFATSMTGPAKDNIEACQTQAAISTMGHFLSPETVAVVGASRDREGIAGRLFHNLVEANFHGSLYPVNPNATHVQGIPAYRSVLDITGPVDLAFIVVPAGLVNGVARECGEKGVRGLVVITSGFAEVGGDGVGLQEELVDICRESGMRLIGPNCMGLVNTDPEVGLNGTFGSMWPPSGRVGFMSQSGALGLAVMDYSTQLGLGLSSFVSVGNKADISGNHLLCYWEADERTDVVLLYLESISNPARFSRITRRMARKKPVIIVKSGCSGARQRAAASHTGSLLATSEATIDALFHQSGVIWTDTLEEMFDVATLLANQPPPKGNRVAIITNSGGLGNMCADACETHGLTVPPLSRVAAEALGAFLPADVSVANPVDMVVSAAPEDYGRAIQTVGEDPDIDAVIVIYIPPDPSLAHVVAASIRDGIEALAGKVPILTVFMSARGLPEELRGDGTATPSYRFPEQAAIALARAAKYGKWRIAPEGRVPSFADVRPEEAAGVIATCLEEGGGWLAPDRVEQLLACYGLPGAHVRRVTTPDEAGAAAVEIGCAVALKGVGPEMVRKKEVGAVRLGLTGAAEVTEAAREMSESIQRQGVELEGFVVQPMVEDGVEILVGVFHDRLFGPVVACGAGGTAVELVNDISVRITPLTDLDATEMVRSLATFPLLRGYGGSPSADIAALEDLLLRVSALAENHPEVAEMNCSPVMVLPRGAVIVDSRVRIEAPPPRRPPVAIDNA